MAQFGRDVIEIDQHRRRERGEHEPVLDPRAEGPDDDQRRQEVRCFVEWSARDQRRPRPVVHPVHDNERHRGRREGAR
jgi:hypothetical protein